MQALVLIVAVLSSAWTQAQPAQPAPPAAGAESLEVQLARARLRLAEVNLKKVEQMNQRVRNTVPTDAVTEYRREVEVAQARLDDALGKGGKGEFDSWLRTAQAALDGAEARLRSALAANQSQPDTVEEVDVQRLRVRVEVARLNLAEGRAVADQPVEPRLRWQVNLLQEEVQQLREQVSRTVPGGRVYSYPLWWW